MNNVFRAVAVTAAIVVDLTACSSSSGAIRDGGGPSLPIDADAGPSLPIDADAGPRSLSDGGLPFIALQQPPTRLDGGVIVADTAPPAISGGTLAVAEDGSVVVAADSDRDRVYVIQPKTDTFATVALEAGSEPGRVVLDGAGHAHVVLRNKRAVVSIDLQTAKLLQQTEVCSQPRGLAFDAESAAILVSCASGELVSVSASAHAELSRTFVARDLRDVVVTKNGERFVSRYRSAELIKVDANGQIVSRTVPRSTTEPRFKPADTLPEGTPGAGAKGAPIPVQTAVTLSPTLAWKTILGADGTPLMLHQRSQLDEIAIGVVGAYGGGGGRTGCDTITHPGVTTFDAQGAPVHSWSMAAPGSIVDVAQSSDGDQLAFARPGAYLRDEHGSIAVRLVSQLSLSEGASADGGIPLGIGACAAGQGFGWDMAVTAVAYDKQGKLYAFSREPSMLLLYAHPLDNPGLLEKRIDLSKVSVRDTGHELFHGDVGSGLACTSCHGEALDDGHVWNFRGIGSRRTQNVRGGLLASLPLHWDGDLPTFGHLVDEVMTRRMGGFRVEPRHADALAHWLDKQPAFKLEERPSGDAALAIERGKQLFDGGADCVRCHSGPLFTNNQTVDVGTGRAFQVPSLLGLALRPPFMHDGCAPTLADRFNPSCGGGDKHGQTSQLGEAQKLDLIRYLETL